MHDSTVADSWTRIAQWLRTNDPTGKWLLPGDAADEEIAAAEEAMGCRLPDDVRESYSIHNGSNRIWLFEQGFLMPLGSRAEREEYTVVGICLGMKDVGEAMKNERGTLQGPIKTDWWNERWIPLTENENGDLICIDLAPEDGGQVGQIIDWWHERAATGVLANSWGQWLALVANEMESGRCRFNADTGTVERLPAT